MSSHPVRRLPALIAALTLFARAASSAHAQCPTTWTNVSTAISPSARAYFAMCYDTARQATVLFGGQHANSAVGQTWEWNGSQWTLRSPASSPSPRELCGMAYDAARGVSVLYGGYDGSTSLGDTWEWNGTNWTQRNPVTSPPIDSWYSLAFDSARNVTVLYGGDQIYNTWEWNGVNWTSRSPSPAPSGGLYSSLAYDVARGVCVEFGGNIQGFSNMTWEWNGNTWSHINPAALPPARASQSITYDSVRHATVLFGGSTSSGPASDTWQYDGATWTQLAPAVSPPPRMGQGMAYDSARGRVVMFGGYSNGSSQFSDTWELSWQSPAPAITQQPLSHGAALGENLTISIAAANSPTSYQWRKNGAPLADDGRISGAQTPSLTINTFAPADVNQYDCLVGNSCGYTASAAAFLMVDSCKFQGPASSHSLRFHGPAAGDYVFVPSSNAFNLTSGFTVETWVKPDGIVNGYQNLISKPSAWNFSLNAGRLTFGTVFILDYFSTGVYVEPNVWTHIAVVFDTNYAANYYVNGQFVESVHGPAPAATSPDPLILGAYSSAEHHNSAFAGQLDEIRIWNTMRTPSEIASNFNTTIPPGTPGLVAYYRFDEGGGSTTADSSGNNHNATLVISPEWTTNAADCNNNGVLDSCEITYNPSLDANHDGVLDSCQTNPTCPGDMDANGVVDGNDIQLFVNRLLSGIPCP